MKSFLLATSILIGAFSQLAPAASKAETADIQPVRLVSQRVEPLILMKDCKIVQANEPKGILTYKVKQYDGVKTVSRPIYSDLCNMPTQQFITKIFFELSKSEQAPIMGVIGGNEDNDTLAYPAFSGFVLHAK
jgi:hypothetical protein